MDMADVYCNSSETAFFNSGIHCCLHIIFNAAILCWFLLLLVYLPSFAVHIAIIKNNDNNFSKLNLVFVTNRGIYALKL